MVIKHGQFENKITIQLHFNVKPWSLFNNIWSLVMIIIHLSCHAPMIAHWKSFVMTWLPSINKAFIVIIISSSSSSSISIISISIGC